MRSILIFVFLLISSLSSAATYYIATNGSDGNPGTISAPFATWQKGFTVAQPGDIVYVRGGTYYPTGTSGHDAYSGVYIRGKNGTSTNMINIWAYPGEKPILDCKNMTNAASHIGVYLDDCDYWYLKGLTIKNCLQTPGYGAHGLWLRTGNYNRFELIDISYVGGSGLCVLYEAEKNYIYNCDIHDCFDQYTKNSDGTPNPGEHADGVDLASITERPGNERVNTIRGVRAWNNADDGFDHYNVDGVLIIDSCWVWHNGYNYGGTTPTGNGNGFKLGVANGTPESYAMRTVTNCIAYDNRQRGYSQEAANVNMILYNNIAYKNKLQGFAFVAYDRPDVLRNNISYSNSSNTFQPKQTHDHNSWDSGVTVSDADFASLDASQLLQPRKANGCLPDITFLALATGSDLIDKGVNVGIAYSGSAPDMGAFEKSSAASAPAPAYVSSVVPAATPTKLEITFSLALANIIPSASSFTVMVNSASRSVSSVAVSGTKVTLTLSSPVVEGNTITVAYTKPSSNPLQGTSSTQAASFSAKTVTNSVPATAAPAYVSSVVPSSAPGKIEISFSPGLANILPSASSFTVMVNSASRAVSSVAVSGTKVTLTLSSPVAAGNTVTVAYTKPSSNPLQGTSSTQVESFSAKTVTNSVSAASAPSYVSSVVPSSTPTIIEITFSLALANVLPSASSFTVMVNSASRAVSSVAVSGTKVTLTLSSPVAAGNTVTVAYTKPSANPLQGTSSSQVASFSGQTVTNSVPTSTTTMQYVSSVVESAKPSEIKVTYNLTLANVLCDPSRFAVSVDSEARTVTAISISGTNVFLTLASPIAAGNVVTVGYSKPATNLLVSTTGSQVPNMTAITVTNLVASLSPEITYLGSVVENETPSVLSLNYSEPLANILPPASSFSVTVNSVARTVNSLSISGSKVLLNIAGPVFSGNIVTVAYTKPASDILQSSAGALVSTMSFVPVTNNVLDAHLYLGSVIQSPSVIQITYNHELVPVAPPSSCFNVIKDGEHINVNSIQVSGTSVFLTLETPVASGEEVILDYIVPATNPVQFLDAAITSGLEDVVVENNLQGVVPEYLSASIASSSTDLLNVIFSSELSSRTPSSSSFTVKINGITQPVKTVIVAGNTVTLTMQTSVFKGDIVLVSYIKPSENSLQAVSGGNVAGFSEKPVANNTIDEGTVTVYPNPATDYINISNLEPTTETMVVRIFNLAGKVCLEEYLDSFSTNRIQFKLNTGMYVVQVVMGSVVKHVEKLIIR